MGMVKVEFHCPYCPWGTTGEMDRDAEDIKAGDVWERVWQHLYERHEKMAAEIWFKSHWSDVETAVVDDFERCPFCGFVLSEDEDYNGLDVFEHIKEEHYDEALAKALRGDTHEVADWQFQTVIDKQLKEVA